MRVRIPGVPYCRCRVLSGCVRAGEGCFRLCQLCLGNARIIMIIGRGGKTCTIWKCKRQAAGTTSRLQRGGFLPTAAPGPAGSSLPRRPHRAPASHARIFHRTLRWGFSGTRTIAQLNPQNSVLDRGAGATSACSRRRVGAIDGRPWLWDNPVFPGSPTLSRMLPQETHACDQSPECFPRGYGAGQLCLYETVILI